MNSRHSILSAWLVASVGLASTFAAPRVALADAPQWIWSAAHDAAVNQRAADSIVRLEKTFQIDGVVPLAKLRLAADFCRARVELNGRGVLMVESYSPTAEHEVTAHLVSGTNRIRIVADRCCGPSAVAFSLSLETGDGKWTSIVTDGTWQVDGMSKAATLGAVEPELWGLNRRSSAVDPFENYEQWRTATATAQDLPAFSTAPGFEIAQVRKAQPDEGSWISMAFDPKGRLTVSREDQGLLRMTLDEKLHTVTRVETIDEKLQECRGLLYAYDALYANANNSKGLYRLRDTDGDDRFDEVKLLREFPGRVGHGRNDLALGGDGLIYSIHGDSVELPSKGAADRTSPFREARRGKTTSEGYLVRTDRDGQQWEVVCAGLRNPYGVAVHPSGDLFTYDADAEFDMGTPWYRPTRVVQLRSGADYGWRGVTGQWPPYFADHADNALPSLDIGRGSPTAAMFGTNTSFPPPYRQALYVLDWSYGRMLAIHQSPRGAGYRSQAETFLQGRPLNLTDVAVGPDGAMYLVTGGRKTQSAIYRVTFTGKPVAAAKPTTHQQACEEQAAKSRAVLKRLESLHGRVNASAVETAWPHLDDADPAIRYAARLAIEHQPLETWRQRALSERRTTAALSALQSLAASGEESATGEIFDRLLSLRAADLDLGQALMLVHLHATVLDRSPSKVEARKSEVVAQLTSIVSSLAVADLQVSPLGTNVNLQRGLAGLLVRLKATGAAESTVRTLLRSDRQEDRLHGLLVLRGERDGWTPQGRHDYFAALNEMSRFVSGEGMPKFQAHLREDSLATLSDAERTALKDVLEPTVGPAESEPPASRPLVKKWTSEDFAELLAGAPRGDAKRGETVFRDAQCARCHRVGARGPAVGPDLSFVGRRFSRRDMLESILSPSKVVAEHYRNVQVTTKDGRTIVGRVLIEGDFRSETLRIAHDPLRPAAVVVINKRELDEYRLSDLSPMPQGLLDGFAAADVLDLLAYLEAGPK